MKKFTRHLFISGLLILAGVFVLFCLDVKAGVMANYYVSPSGSDENAGTEALPFKTIEKARDVIRAGTDIWTGDINVWIRAGTYRLTGTLEFTAEDSGKDGYSVFYQAYPGEEVIISGGVQITGWTKAEGNIYKAACPPQVDGFRQLYVDGKRAVRARTPNAGDHYRLYQWRVSDQTVRVNAAHLDESWQNMADGKVEIVIQQYWAESIMRIASVNTNGAYKDIVPNATERDIVFGREWPQKSPEQAYHFENSLDFVDRGGEWYLDDNAVPAYLYYMPREEEDMAQLAVFAPVIDTLVSIKGADLDSKVHDLAFKGITFEYANWTRPNREGNIGLQSHQYSVGNNQCDRPAAGVFVQNAHHIDLVRNEFRNMGAAGLDVYTGTDHITIEGNVFHDIAGNGMQVGKFTETGTVIAETYNPADTREFCEDIRIANNYIYDVARDYYCGNGIAAGYIRFSDIVHNEIKDLPYTGISVGWGWTTNPCAMTNNNIEYNRVYNVMMLLCDGAGIYTLGYSPDSYIRYNFVHGVIKSDWATTSYTTTYPVACIYLDQGSKGYTIDQNVLRNAHNNNYIHDGLNTAGDNIKGTNHRNNVDIEINSGIEPAFKDIKKRDDLIVSTDGMGEGPSGLYKVYPTIVKDKFYIDSNLESPSLEVSVYGALKGDRLEQVNFNNVKSGSRLRVDLGNNLGSGLYLYRIRSARHIVSGKFIVLNE